MDHDFQARLAAFCAGFWRKQPPRAQGLWPIAARDRRFCGFVLVDVVVDPTLGVPRFRYVRIRPGHREPYQASFTADDVHVGWWWIRSVPALPPVAALELIEGGAQEEGDEDV